MHRRKSCQSVTKTTNRQCLNPPSRHPGDNPKYCRLHQKQFGSGLNTYFYENEYNHKLYAKFEQFLNDDIYDEGFTRMDHIESIVGYEKKYTDMIVKACEEYGCIFNPYAQYFIGFGSTSIIYKVIYDGNECVLKLWWGGGESRGTLYENEKKGYQLAVKYHIPVAEVYWFGSIGEYPVMLQKYGGDSIESILKSDQLSQKDRRKIIQQLLYIKQLLSDNTIIHDDLHEGNIVVDHEMTVKLIDLEELKKSERKPRFDIDDIIKRLIRE